MSESEDKMGHFFVAMLLQQPERGPFGASGPFGQYGPFGWPGILIPTLNTLGFFALVGLIGWLIYRWSQTRMQARTEFHRQLLDKFTSGGEFAAFLNSSGGQRLLEDLWSQRVNAKERIVRSMHGGVVLTVLGLGVLGLWSLAADCERNFEPPDAGWLWRKALLEQKQADADRAQRPLLVAELACASAIILAFVVWIGWYWPEVQEHLQVQFMLWQTDPWPRLGQTFWSFVAQTPQLSPFLLVLLLAVAAFLMTHPLLTEE